MKVKSLIKFLEQQDQDAEIYINCYGNLVIKKTIADFYKLELELEKIEWLFIPKGDKMKEVINGKVESQPQRHASKFETIINHGNYESWIYLEDCFPPGEVEIIVSTKPLKEGNDEE